MLSQPSAKNPRSTSEWNHERLVSSQPHPLSHFGGTPKACDWSAHPQRRARIDPGAQTRFELSPLFTTLHAKRSEVSMALACSTSMPAQSLTRRGLLVSPPISTMPRPDDQTLRYWSALRQVPRTGMPRTSQQPSKSRHHLNTGTMTYPPGAIGQHPDKYHAR